MGVGEGFRFSPFLRRDVRVERAFPDIFGRLSFQIFDGRRTRWLILGECGRRRSTQSLWERRKTGQLPAPQLCTRQMRRKTRVAGRDSIERSRRSLRKTVQRTSFPVETLYAHGLDRWKHRCYGNRNTSLSRVNERTIVRGFDQSKDVNRRVTFIS